MDTISSIDRDAGTNAKKQQDTATDQNTVVSQSFVTLDSRKGRSHIR